MPSIPGIQLRGSWRAPRALPGRNRVATFGEAGRVGRNLSHRGAGAFIGMVIILPQMENQMEKKMENEMETLGPFKGVYRDITPIMENQMEKKMENEMETGIIMDYIYYGD